MEVRRINPDELYHHGIKGQRWGVRRYQNADGSYYVSGWQEIDGSTYYFDENGDRTTGWMAVGNEDYYFTEEGV